MSTLGFLNVGSKKYSLRYGESYVIGFMSNDYAHDIEINDKSVDIRHCIVDFTEPMPKIFDIKSKCGTFVDHERIPSCCMFPLKNSANIQIGDVETIFHLAEEGDSGYLEQKLTPAVKEIILTPRSTRRVISAESRATNPSIVVSKSDHQFIVPTATSTSIKSKGSLTTNDSFDSFSIPETQAPVKSGVTQADDNEDNFYIPETQDVISANAVLCNYPRLAFGNEDVNETISDCDKIPSSQFRICTQDFNGSADEQNSNHSDDILANVPCSLVIPTIRHSPVQISDISLKKGDGNEEIESELQCPKASQQSAVDSLILPNQAQTDKQIANSQCSTPDIFSDHDSLDDVDKSLKENDPPAIVVGYIKQSQVILRPPIKKVASLPNCNENSDQQKNDAPSLPPTQVFVPPPLKTKHPLIIENEKPKPTDMIDDLPPTQVFQPIPDKSKKNFDNLCLSSTLVDSGMQLSESSFKAKCNKLLDSDDDEMDEVVAPELVNKYRQYIKTVKDDSKTSLYTVSDSSKTPNTKMLPPKNIPIHVGKSCTSASAEKQKLKNSNGYVNIEEFLCTPDFMGEEFTKDIDLQKKAEQNWTKRKSLFKDEATPTKPIKNESDESQDSFSELIPHKKKQEEILRNIVQKEYRTDNQNNTDVSTIGTEGRISQRRQPSVETKTFNFKSISESKVDDVKKMTKSMRIKKSVVEVKAKVKKDISPKAKKSKDSNVSKSKRKKHSGSNTSYSSTNSLEINAEAISTVEKVVKENAKRKTRHNLNNSNSLLDDKVSQQLLQSTPNKVSEEKFNNSDVSVESSKSSKSSSSSIDKLPIGHKWTEKRILEVVLNKNGTRKYKTNMIKSTSTIDSSYLSGIRSRTRSSDASVPSRVSFNTSHEDHSKLNQKLPLKASGDGKKLSSSPKDKSKSKIDHEEEKVAIVETGKGKRQPALNKIVEEDGDKPQRRVTRLASARQGEAATTTNQRTEAKQLKSTRGNRGRMENPKGKPKPDTADLKESDNEERPNSRTASSGVKRKNCEDGGETKRSRSASSESIKLNTTKTKPKLRIAMTMCDPRYQEILEKHSGSLWIYTKDPKECDILILEKGNRTYKLMVAIARGIPVVKLDWLVEVLKKRSTNVPTEEYIFQDRQFQDRHQFLMKKSLFLANTSPLFKGMSFMMTPNIRPSPNEMEDIIKCAGGTVLDQVPKLKQRMYLISQSKDNQYWHQYRRSNSNLKIVTTEGVMASVMQQSETPLIKSIIQ